MKNIHILEIDKPIKNVGDLVKDQYGDIHIFTKNDGKEYGKTTTKLNIYITSDEEIKEGDWIFDIVTKKNEIAKFNHNDLKRDWKKIILTTDPDLIKDGVQAIDDEFLEWFVKNPSCEEVEVEMNQGRYFDYGGNIHITNAYKIIIPKEETLNLKQNTHYVDFSNPNADKISSASTTTIKKETLEEVAENFSKNHSIYDSAKDDTEYGFINGAKWQEQQTIEEVFEWLTTNNYLTDLKETLIENFKKR